MREEVIESFDLEKRYVRKDGTIVWGRLTISSIRKSDGSIDYFVSVVQDISARKCAEQQIRLLMCEVNHRAKNMLSLVQAIAHQTTNGIKVRVIEYELKDVEGSEPVYRLVTTILDHEQAPAQELAALYHERWEIETALDEFKTHLRGAGIVLRSKTPDLVRQEFYGLLMAHFATRGLMHEAALKADVDPDNLSFIHAVRVIRRKLGGFAAIPPSAEACLL